MIMNSIIPETIEEPGLGTPKVGSLEASSGDAANMHTIKGQVAVITGAAGGIGQALALDMARRGAACIALVDYSDRVVRLAREIDWGFLDRRFASVCTPGPGQPGLPTRLVAGLFILKHMHNLSDEVLCALAGEPLLPILLRRAELLPQTAV